MRHGRVIFIALVCALIFGASVSCSKNHHSAFAEQAIKPADLIKMKYRPLKNGAVGLSFSGFLLSVRAKPMPSATCLSGYKKKASRQMESTLDTRMRHPIEEDSGSLV
jgi:hypothetical protein